IRKDPPESSTVASAPTKQPKCSTAGLCTRPRAGDFDELTQAVLDTAIGEYRAIICTRDPFPDAVSNQEISAQVWVNACASLDIQIQPSLEIMKLITNRAAEVRGRVKSTARCIVPIAYRLSKLNEDDANRQIVVNLLTKNSYLYRDVATREGCLLTPIVPDIINSMWFKDKEDDGVVFSNYFGSEGEAIPLQTVALVCTAIENCLDEYHGGAFKDIVFTRSAYRARYATCLRYLEDFATKTKEAAIIPRLCQRLLKLGRKHARAHNAQLRELLVDDLQAESATREWEGMTFSDEE
ncbi:hypothetical protein BGW80DRAFT_1193224, partial [Lactifluus volemus]